MRVTHQQRASLLALARHAAENEPHEGKRKAEAVWPIFRIHHQRSRYIYELYFRRKTISRELYDYCLREGIADANLIAKWKKVRAACCVLVRSLARQLTWRVLATPAGIREALLPSMHPNQGPLVRHRVRVPRTQGQARGGQGGRVPALRLPRLRQRRLIHQRTSLAPSLSVQSRTQPAHPPPRTAVQHATLLHKRRATAAAATTSERARQHRSIGGMLYPAQRLCTRILQRSSRETLRRHPSPAIAILHRHHLSLALAAQQQRVHPPAGPPSRREQY